MDITTKLQNSAGLAKSSEIIRRLKAKEDLTQSQIDWINEVLYINPYTTSSDEEIKVAELAMLLFREDVANSPIILDLNQKIDSKIPFDDDDWTFILYGLKLYRISLLVK